MFAASHVIEGEEGSKAEDQEPLQHTQKKDQHIKILENDFQEHSNNNNNNKIWIKLKERCKYKSKQRNRKEMQGIDENE